MTTGCRDIQRNGDWRSNVNVKCRIVDVSLNISTSSGCIRMKPPPFDAARRDGSNELRYILLRPLDAEIISGTCLYTKGDQIRRYEKFVDLLHKLIIDRIGDIPIDSDDSDDDENYNN